MIRIPVLLLCLASLPCPAQVTVHLSAPQFSGREVVLYRYDDLFTKRTVRIAETRFDDRGEAVLNADPTDRIKAFISVGDAGLDLYLDPGKTYAIGLEEARSPAARTLSASGRLPFVFHDLDPLDINALVSDLNERLDAFLAEDLATDAVAGMQAVRVVKEKGSETDTLPQRPPTLFVAPDLSRARVDTFESKLHRFYRDVPDPWFHRHVELAVADLRVGPRTSDDSLFDRYLKGRPPVLDDPEYVRLVRNIFGEILPAVIHPGAPAEVAHVIEVADMDGVHRSFAMDPRLKDDTSLRELVVIDGLYHTYHSGLFSQAGIRALLEEAASRSSLPGTRRIASNMLWDLTTMVVGTTLPPIATDTSNAPPLDSLLQGPVYVMVLASWCTYCEQERMALEALAATYHPYFTFVVIGADEDATTWTGYQRSVDGRYIHWSRATDRTALMDDLRLRALPAYLLLNGARIARNPAPPPSGGLAAILHKARTEAEAAGRIKFGDDAPPPRR